MTRLLLVLLALGCCVPARGGDARAITIKPLAQVRPQEYSPTIIKQNYGVFVGIDRFDDDSIVGLKFAAADARSMRDCFVNDLGYLAPENARLLVTGAEGKDRPTRNNILEAIDEAIRNAGDKGCIVVHISSHGINRFVLAEDSRKRLLERSSIPLEDIRSMLAESRCPRRLLFIDACRENVSSDTRGVGGNTMTTDAFKAFLNASGFLVMQACSAGEYSYEMPDSGHGAFTHYLLAGLRGEAPHNAEGMITVTTLSKWVSGQVVGWSRNKPKTQTPKFTLDDASGDLPLAVSRQALDDQEAQKKKIAEAAKSLADLLAQNKIDTRLHALAQADLGSSSKKLVQLSIDLSQGRIAPEYYEQLRKPLLPGPDPAPDPTPDPEPPRPSPQPEPAGPPPVISSVELASASGDEYSFTVQASDPAGGALTYVYRLNGQSSDNKNSTGRIVINNIRPGQRALTVIAISAGGKRSAPYIKQFTVEPPPPPVDEPVHRQPAREPDRGSSPSGSQSNGLLIAAVNGTPPASEPGAVLPLPDPKPSTGAAPGSRVYTAYNLFYEDPTEVGSINYNTSKRQMLPAGTPIKSFTINPPSTGWFKRARENKIEVVAENGIILLIDFQEKFYEGRLTIQQFANRLFTTRDFAQLTQGMTPPEVEAIKAGRLEIGMSKAACLVAAGFPPEHKTASLSSDVWIYWHSRMATRAYRFVNDRLAALK